MIGSALTTISPFNSRITRNTPCVDGCCGPMFRTIVCASPVGVSTVVVIGHAALFAKLLRGTSSVPLGRIVLAQRVPFPIVRHQDAPQIRMSLKADAEQVVTLALVPIGRRPHASNRR